MSRERSFKHFYPIPHNGGFIEPIIIIEYEAHDWNHEHAGSLLSEMQKAADWWESHNA